MSMKLRDLIRKVRACKTAAEERAVIAKESAMIRTAIREEQEHYRHRNVAKLLFMHMLGYPTHFGQLECMKLTASPHFPEKRIGYLGMMLLLTEEADVLMLATNSLKNDLNSDNKFVAGLSLCCIGNLATADMSRDLMPEVDKHLKSSLPYLRKKACLAMARCLSKCPDMVEDFVDRVITLLKDKSHGVLITVVQLMTQVLLIDIKNAEEEGQNVFETTCRKSFLRLVPTLVKMLRNLLSMGYSPEHDIGGISDPFLQVQLLTLLRLLGINDVKASEEMNDVLAQVATNTETSKNAGNAILYECVQTIMAVESEDSLRVLAVNILGRFLLNRDNNIRYVALNTLSRCITEEQQSGRDVVSGSGENANNASSALQRHRTTIVDCLKDPDVSIRQRALELIYHLVNSENVESLTAELLNYLVLCPREHRADICTRILRVVDRYSPDDRWRVDTLITMLTIAGRESTRDVLNAAIVYISRASADIQAYATHRLLKAIRDDDGSQRGLLNVGIWCIGEFGDYLLKPDSSPSPSSGLLVANGAAAAANNSHGNVNFLALDPMTVVNTVEEVIKRHSCPEDVKQRALTCFAKLSDRFADKGDREALAKLHKLVKKHQTSVSLELQLRSCEYDALLNAAKGVKAPVKTSSDDIFGVTNGDAGVSAKVSSAAKEALARMPVVDLKVMQRRQATDENGDDGEVVVKAPAAAKVKGGGDLLDLDDIFGGGGGAAPVVQAPQSNGLGAAKTAEKSANAKSDLDLLSDIFSAPAPSASVMPAPSMGHDPFAVMPSQPIAANPINPMDLFGAPPPTAAAPLAAPAGIDIFSSLPMQQPSLTTNSQLAQNPMHPTPTGPMSAVPPPVMSMSAVPNPVSAIPNVPNPAGLSPVISTPSQPLASNAAQASTDGVKVPGFSHGGITVEFECLKPDVWNKQKSTLIASFLNTTDAPIYGFNMQCAVPKYVTMEMLPPSSTTIPIAAGSQAKMVTQQINVINTMLGTKNLVLKLKVGFTSKGTKIEHLATCSGFPAGQF